MSNDARGQSNDRRAANGAVSMSDDVPKAAGSEHIRRRPTKSVGAIDVSVFRLMQNTIDTLTDTIQRGEVERNQLAEALRMYQRRPAPNPNPHHREEFGASVESTSSIRSSGPQAHHRDPHAHHQANTRGHRPVSPAHRTVSPGHRSISPSAAYQRVHSAFSQQRGGSGEGGSAGAPSAGDASNWKLSFHADGGGLDVNHRTYKELLADNRSLLQKIDSLHREHRKLESDYETRLHRMQRTLTDTTERYNAVVERASLMEVQLKQVKKTLRPGAQSAILNSSFTRSMSFKHI